jgi:N-acetylmuramoyl-L-alanine amidase
VEGKLLAEAIQRNLLEALDSVDRGARTHWVNLVVLAETDMPAALAEVGFVTNPEEEALLLDPEYRAAGAQGIADGVLEYLKWSTTVYTTE